MPPKKNPASFHKINSVQNNPARPEDLSDQTVLRLTADRFEFMFDHFLLPKAFNLPSGEITANQAFCDMLGYSRAEMLGKTWQDITHPDDQAISQEANKLLQSGEKDSVRVTKRYLHKSGTVVWAEVSACVRRDEAGQALYFITEITDLSLRKQAEQALQASMEKIRTLVDTMTEGVALNQAVFDGNGRIVDYRILEVNAAFYQVADFEAGQVIGKLATQLYKMEPDFIQAFWDSHKKDSTPIHTELLSPLNQRTYYISTSPIQNDTFVTTFVDITERKQMEMALKQSEEKFRRLSENSLSGISIIQDNHLIYVNPSLAGMFGFSPEEIVNQPIPTYLIHPDDIQAAFSRLQQRLDGKDEKRSAIFKTFKKDGSSLAIEVYGTVIEYQGRPAVMGTILDVTERSRASEALRASEERLREVLENSLDASYKRDLKTNRYEYLSPVFSRLSGYSPEEMKIFSLESVLELIHPDDLPEVNRRLAEALSGPAGAAWQVEYRFKNKHGQYCWFQDRFTIMHDEGGQPVALIGSVSDVTDRKEAEEALHQKMDELERFQRLTVGRELRMVEMKNEINALLVQAGQPAKYPLLPERQG
jgi:PAS domain S-box-containing protein